MGNKHGTFSKEKLEELQDCTYFSGRQIKRLYKRFAMINPQRINPKVADFDTKLIPDIILAMQIHSIALHK